MTKIPLLSFCVFTYNQPDAVRRLLEHITPQLTFEVEVLIRDDSADDATERVVRSFSNFETIRYFRGPKEGVDNAILFLLREARGKYFWGFGDDDLDPRAILKVLTVLCAHPEVTFLIMNCREAGKSASEFQMGPERFFQNREEALTAFADLLNYVSILVYDRGIALAGMKDIRPFIGSACISFYMALQVLSREGRYYFLDYPCVVADSRELDAKLWYDPFKVYAVNTFLISQSFRDKFRRRAIKKMVSLIFRGVWRGMLIQRAKGYSNGFGFSYSKLAILLKLYWSFPEFWLALPFLVMPRFILRFFYRIYKFVFPRSKSRLSLC